MNIGKWLIAILIVAGLGISGCAKLLQLYPSTTPAGLKSYVGTDCKKAGIDPNDYGWDCMAKLKAMLELAHEKHELTQAYIVYKAHTDNISYGDANSIGSAEYIACEKERSALLSWAVLIGVSLLTGGTGAGVASLITNAIKNSTMYSEAEHQLGIQGAIANNYTKDEVQAIIDKIKLGQTVVL